eukprot:9488149-Pyramimonas_sp.AAC.1
MFWTTCDATGDVTHLILDSFPNWCARVKAAGARMVVCGRHGPARQRIDIHVPRLSQFASATSLRSRRPTQQRCLHGAHQGTLQQQPAAPD